MRTKSEEPLHMHVNNPTCHVRSCIEVASVQLVNIAQFVHMPDKEGMLHREKHDAAAYLCRLLTIHQTQQSLKIKRRNTHMRSKVQSNVARNHPCHSEFDAG